MTETAVETPDAEATEVEEKPAKAVKEATVCACSLYSGQDVKGNELSTGCTEKTVRTFRPGHDAKLKSLLIKVGSAGNEVIKTVGDEVTSMQPVHAAEEYGFRNLVEKSLETAKGREDARKAKAAKRAEVKAAAEAKKEAARVEREKRAAAKRAHAEAVAKAESVANENKTPGPAKAKVGRSTVEGEVLEDGKFRYTNAKNETVEVENYKIVVDPTTVAVPEAN